MWIISASDSRLMDEVAQRDYGISIETLMENAGSAVFEAIKRHVSPPASIAFLCGPGHNGADGIIAARKAHEAGFKVATVFTSERNELSEETLKQLKLASGRKGVNVAFPADDLYATTLERLCAYNLIVDAILGTGQKGDLRGNVSAAVNAIRMSGTPVISVDVPTGIETDTGKELGCSVWALETVVLGYPKRFLFQGQGLEHSGFWQVADIGLPKWTEKSLDLFAMSINPLGMPIIENSEEIGFELPERTKSSHKGSNGHVLIVAGSRTMPGAAVLAANAALKAGAGLVSVASIQEVCDIVSGRLPECLTIPLPIENGCIAAKAVSAVRENSSKFDSAVFGPGMTHNDSVRDFLSELWKEWEIPSCIDADALNAVAMGTELPAGPCILTPHPGEMARLLGTSADAVEADRFGAVAGAANKFQRTVLLKGPYTLCSHPHKESIDLEFRKHNWISVNTTGNPGMATGGMGDVLSGMIGTLLAQDLGDRAAMVAAHWHGIAGDICAQEIGTVGYLPTDVCNALPTARAKLTSLCL